MSLLSAYDFRAVHEQRKINAAHREKYVAHVCCTRVLHCRTFKISLRF